MLLFGLLSSRPERLTYHVVWHKQTSAYSAKKAARRAIICHANAEGGAGIDVSKYSLEELRITLSNTYC